MGVYTGTGVGFAKFIHPLDSEDGDLVGPGAYTLTGATIEATNARFGLNLRADAAGERLDGDSGVAGFDDNDGKKILYHTFVQLPNLTGVKTFGGITNAGFGINRTRIFFDVSRIRVDWTRQSDLGGPSTQHIRVSSAPGHISVDTSHALVGFLDSGSIGQGKIFIDGTDRTASAVASGIFGALAGNHNQIRLGNHINGLDPGQFVDHYTIIQDDSLTDALVALLVAQYYSTRSFGFRPTLTSLSVSNGFPGTPVIALGGGYGLDVVFKIDGVPVDSQVRVDEGQVTFDVPALSPGVHDLSITNVLADVIFTESNFFTVPETPVKVIGTDAIEKRKLRVEFDRDVKQVDAANSNDALNPGNYFFFIENQPEFTAVYLPASIVSIIAITPTLVEIEVNDDLSFGRDYKIDVRNVESISGGLMDQANFSAIFTAFTPELF